MPSGSGRGGGRRLPAGLHRTRSPGQLRAGDEAAQRLEGVAGAGTAVLGGMQQAIQSHNGMGARFTARSCRRQTLVRLKLTENFSMRIHPFASACAAAILALASTVASSASLSYLGQQVVANNAVYGGTTIGGLSGIDFDAASVRYVAISDDRSQINPARFYSLQLDLSQFARSNTPGSAGVQFTGVTTLLTRDGSPFAANGVDPESIRLRQTASGTTVLWTNEGLRSGSAASYQTPTLREATLSGAYVRDFAVPSYYFPVGSAAGTTSGDSGIRNNLAFESLTLSPDGSTTYIATENALVQDGSRTTLTAPSPSRVAAFDTATGALSAEYIYNVDPIAQTPVPATASADRGLVEMLSLGQGRFIAVERSFATGVGFDIRVYLTEIGGATNVAGLSSVAGTEITAMAKTLLLDMNSVRNADGSALLLDNIEGVTLGPVVNGKQTLIFVSDNNFNNTELTQFVAFTVDGNLLTAAVPEPQSGALLAAGLGLVVLRVARRNGQR